MVGAEAAAAVEVAGPEMAGVVEAEALGPSGTAAVAEGVTAAKTQEKKIKKKPWGFRVCFSSHMTTDKIMASTCLEANDIWARTRGVRR